MTIPRWGTVGWCAKCGEPRISSTVSYFNAGRSDGSVEGEHMILRCPCGYGWYERPQDWDEPPVTPVAPSPEALAAAEVEAILRNEA